VMKVVKPAWVAHKGQYRRTVVSFITDHLFQTKRTRRSPSSACIFIRIVRDWPRADLVSCLCRAKKMVSDTDTVDAKVKIWSTLPILSEEAEQNDANPKLLSTLTLHNGMSHRKTRFQFRFLTFVPFRTGIVREMGSSWKVLGKRIGRRSSDDLGY
jgi:hypothetical protein